MNKKKNTQHAAEPSSLWPKGARGAPQTEPATSEPATAARSAAEPGGRDMRYSLFQGARASKKKPVPILGYIGIRLWSLRWRACVCLFIWLGFLHGARGGETPIGIGIGDVQLLS